MKTKMGVYACLAVLVLTALLLAGLPPAAQAAPEPEEASRGAFLAPETISAGGWHGCAIKTDGTLSCWGLNNEGQATPPDGTFSQLSAGLGHTCALRGDGTVACWGYNGDGRATAPEGTFVQLGSGDFHTCGVRTDGSAACWGQNDTRQATPPTGTFVQVTTGWLHSCGLRADGTLACWGNESYGQATPPGGTFGQLSAGMAHNCGVRSDGSLACWGRNEYGQATPPDGAFTQVNCGELHSCGIRTDGTLACWGQNDYGEATPPDGTFVQVNAGIQYTCGLRTDGTLSCWGRNLFGESTSPTGSFGQRRVSAGTDHTCSLKADGTVACWGSDIDGKATPPEGTFTQVSAGVFHTCGLRFDGTVACWGRSYEGQASAPGGTFTQVSVGDLHSCGLKTDGTLACWGSNGKGQTSVPEGTFVQVAAGGQDSCGLRTDGTLTCWGDDYYGQATPPEGIFSQVSTGDGHSCGLKTDGTLACWGSNNEGQATPPGGTFSQVSAGWRHSCGLGSDGTVACWGNNHWDQAVPLPESFVQISAGRWHTCGTRADGMLVCWGNSGYWVGPSDLPDGAVGAAFSQAFTAFGGLAPYTFSIVAGSLPVGLELSEEGLLSGTPTELATNAFTVQVVDANSLLATRAYTLVVNVAPQVTADPADLTVDEGAAAAFSAAADGTPTPTVLWEVSTDAGATWGPVEGGASTDLSFAASLEQDGNQYRAAFTNVAGSATTGAAALTVAAVPPTVALTGPGEANEGEVKTYAFTSSDPGGGPFSLVAQGCGASGTLSNDSFDPATGSGGFVCTFPEGPATSTVSVQVQDRAGAAGGASSVEVSVANLVPEVGTVTVSAEPSILGSAAVAGATFGDAGADDAPFSCTVDYGDGSGSLPGTVEGMACGGPAHTYAAVGSYTVILAVTDKDGGTGSASAVHAVVFGYSGFFSPVDSLPVVNVANAGRSIPVKFSLAGDHGLNIIAAGYPLVELQACESGPADPIDSYEQGSGLSYDPDSQQYTYVWKTLKAWAGQCGRFKILLVDGTLHEAEFKFK